MSCVYDDVAREAARDGARIDAADEGRADAAALRRELDAETASLLRQGDEAAWVAATWGVTVEQAA